MNDFAALYPQHLETVKAAPRQGAGRNRLRPHHHLRRRDSHSVSRRHVLSVQGQSALQVVGAGRRQPALLHRLHAGQDAAARLLPAGRLLVQAGRRRRADTGPITSTFASSTRPKKRRSIFRRTGAARSSASRDESAWRRCQSRGAAQRAALRAVVEDGLRDRLSDRGERSRRARTSRGGESVSRREVGVRDPHRLPPPLQPGRGGAAVRQHHRAE